MFLIPTVEPGSYDYFLRSGIGGIGLNFYRGWALSTYIFSLSIDERNPKLGEGFCKESKQSYGPKFSFIFRRLEVQHLSPPAMKRRMQRSTALNEI